MPGKLPIPIAISKASGIAMLVLTAATALIAQAERAHLGDPAIANEYVRVWKLNLLPGSSTLVPAGHVHILIGKAPVSQETPATLTDSSDAAPLRTLDLRRGGVWLLNSVQHQISNPNQVELTGLLLELQTDPGRVSCTVPKDCFWSIRPGDPLPVLLSEHVTIFAIEAPWKPEPRSLIVPTCAVFIDGKKQSAWEPLWVLSSLEITGSGHSFPNRFARGSSFLEIAFYDHPFCSCKRVRNH